jgi:uncharacterized membrane protein
MRGFVRALHVERCYLVLAVLFGSVFLLITPPFQVADEPAHFYRSFQISESGWIASRLQDGAVGGMLPSGLATTATRMLGNIPGQRDQHISAHMIIDELSGRINSAERIPIAFQNTALYSPLPYLPQALGIGLVRLLSPSSPLGLLYGARTFNLITSILFCYWAIKITPIGKWAFFLLALAPMTVFQAASASGDAITIGLTLLAAASFFYILKQTPPLQTWQLALLLALAAGLALVKPPYAIIVGLFICLPASKFASKQQRHWFIITLILVTLFLVTSWALIAHDLYRPSRPDVAINPTAQLNLILQSPMHYLRAVFATHGITGSIHLLSQFVGVLGWLDTPIPLWAVWLYYVLFVLALAPPQPALLPSHFQRLSAFGMWLVTFGAIDALLYLTWTKVGDMKIEGLQGRYYLPLAPLLVIVGYGLIAFKQNLTIRRCTFILGIIVILATAIFMLVFRYYPIRVG